MFEGRSKLGYIPALDGLRGMAIIGVMIYHAGILKGGSIGVDMFFVLSGFLITSLLISEFDGYGSINLKNFYIRRILRLAPALIVMLIVYCLASFVVLSEEKANRNYIDALISVAYLTNWARAFSIHPPDFLGHTWSLSIEEQFYIVWPTVLVLLLRLSNKRHHILVVAASTALLSWMLRLYLSMNGSSPIRLYNGLDTRADALMVGCTLGVVLVSGLGSENAYKTLQKHLVILGPLSMIGLLTFSVIVYWGDPWMFHYGYFIVELLTAVLVLDLLINQKSIIRKLLVTRWLVWVGSISYGLYIWHFPIYRTLHAMGVRGSTFIVLSLFISFTIATLSYYAMEKPILKFKKRFVS